MAITEEASVTKTTVARGMAGWVFLTLLQKFNAIFACSKTVTLGGADGGHRGVNGSVNAASTQDILRCLDAEDKVVFDFGAAQGLFMFCAAAAGARAVHGIEFGQNVGYQIVFDAVFRRLRAMYNVDLPFEWHAGDIEDPAAAQWGDATPQRRPTPSARGNGAD